MNVSAVVLLLLGVACCLSPASVAAPAEVSQPAPAVAVDRGLSLSKDEYIEEEVPMSEAEAKEWSKRENDQAVALPDAAPTRQKRAVCTAVRIRNIITGQAVVIIRCRK